PTTPQDNSATGYRDIVMIHLSELYLVAAEAYLMTGDEDKALEYINHVRQRAKAPALSSFSDYKPDYAMSEGFTLRQIDLLLDERARELFAERTRWMDLRRTKQLVRYNIEFNQYVKSIDDMCNNKGEVKWYRPIPAAEIETNTAISSADQNPGY
ncbi:MAG: RagB/SusD family nutrient uptake outer membrane protein, partial [Prevotella sp.]